MIKRLLIVCLMLGLLAGAFGCASSQGAAASITRGLAWTFVNLTGYFSNDEFAGLMEELLRDPQWIQHKESKE